MLKSLKQKKGFASFVEIVITSVIFVVAALGILASISLLRSHGTNSSQRLEASYLAKQMIDQLRANVDARIWDNTDSGLVPLQRYSTSVGEYTINWYLTNVENLPIRELFLNVYAN